MYYVSHVMYLMVFIYTTCATLDEAKRLGRLMVESKMAACVDLWPIQSMYNWKGKFEDIQQIMLMITTLESKLQAVDDLISNNHSYATPLIAGVDVRRVNHEYKEWLVKQIA